MKLLQHQIEGLEKIKDIERISKGGILADDMGMGKTFQMISYLKLNKVKTSKKYNFYKPDLIICPFSLLKYWKEQIEKLYETFEDPKEVSIFLYHGKDKNSLLLNKDYDYVISTYGSVSDELGKINWGRIILDEAHAIKNGVSKKCPVSAEKIYKIMNSSDYRWCITGTPFNNKMRDLVSLAKFIGTEPYNDISWWKNSTPENIEHWRQTFIIRRTKDKLIKAPIYHEYKIEPTDVEKEKIKNLKKIAENKFDSWRNSTGLTKCQLQGEILSLIMKLRMYSNSYLCEGGFISADHAVKNCSKISHTINLLEDIIEKDPVKGVVIFSQFTSYLTILEKVILETLDIQILRFDGTLNENQREDIIEKFTTSTKSRVLLISLMAGGVGINLKPCSTIIISEPWYNPFIEKQAEERVHRLGQENQVNIHKFLVNNSVEIWISGLKAKKLNKANNLSLANKWDMGSNDYNFKDLRMLFSKYVNFKDNKSPEKRKLKKPVAIKLNSKKFGNYPVMNFGKTYSYY
jgi:SNF2 family DNA or RNA helicase